MSGDAGVQKVTAALQNVQGVSTQAAKVGAATIGADLSACNAACAAVATAGFKSREGVHADQAGSASNQTASPTAPGRKSGHACATAVKHAAAHAVAEPKSCGTAQPAATPATVASPAPATAKA